MKSDKTKKLIEKLQKTLTNSERTLHAIDGYSTVMVLPSVMKETVDRAYSALKMADKAVAEAFAPLWKGRKRKIAQEVQRSRENAPRNAVRDIVAQYESSFKNTRNCDLTRIILPEARSVIKSKTDHNKYLSLYQAVHNYRKENPALRLRVRKS